MEIEHYVIINMYGYLFMGLRDGACSNQQQKGVEVTS